MECECRYKIKFCPECGRPISNSSKRRKKINVNSQIVDNVKQKISIREAAEIMGKGQQFLRMALQRGLFPFGTAVKSKQRWSYYISPKLFYEYVGKGDMNNQIPNELYIER